ncbi:unnamed protein product [Rangifer tarandus platyrhynchus]|uniref:Uncharacterized protein n=2 Tax=Rangifer tarandus platyrhynchus TaxID=3082113 RepID=A0ABN8Y717_RANTA|nr:unnamed protein product [Rangifer tarandus platyrhynchus]CAI9695223.1 unnamed protein product [Rangifer tarandus platyrhynchus]
MLLGWVNALMSCVQPLWKVTVFISNGIVVAQIVFVISAVLTLIPGFWTAHTIIRNLYTALVSEAQKRKLGASIYLD